MGAPVLGDRVYVQAQVDQGAFPAERFVTVETKDGSVSGFAKADFVVNKGGRSYLLAEVKGVHPDNITVMLFGSFFTTTGLANIPSNAICKAAQ